MLLLLSGFKTSNNMKQPHPVVRRCCTYRCCCSLLLLYISLLLVVVVAVVHIVVVRCCSSSERVRRGARFGSCCSPLPRRLPRRLLVDTWHRPRHSTVQGPRVHTDLQQSNVHTRRECQGEGLGWRPSVKAGDVQVSRWGSRGMFECQGDQQGMSRCQGDKKEHFYCIYRSTC